MTWKRSLWLGAAVMLLALLVVHQVVSRLALPGQAMTILGVASIFPAGNFSKIDDAKNNWQGFAFARGFRFFSRPSLRAREDLDRLARENFSGWRLRQDLDLFAGGVYALQKAGKGYRMFCLFCQGGMNYWADMRSRDSLHFSRLAFERFILNLEIDGKRVSPGVAGQVAALRDKISPFFMQSPDQLLGLLAAGFALAMLAALVLFRFSGSCPRRLETPAQICTPGVTLAIRGFGRRTRTACCLCRQGEFLVIYRFRRPYLKIDILRERQNIVWEKRSFRYKNIRVILNESEFQEWRVILLA